MFRKTATTVGVALAGVALLLASPSIALADELPPDPAPVLEEPAAPVDAATIEAPAPVVEEPAPVVDEAPTPPAEATVPEPVVLTPTPATKTLKWVLPDGGTPDNVTWPQPVFDAAYVPCGTSVWVQVDVYPYTTPEDQARTDALDDDGVLRLGEDHGWAQSWSFEQFNAPACVTVLPANPQASLVGSCGIVSVTLTNPLEDGTLAETAAFVVNVDGGFHGAYSVAAGGSQAVVVSFPEDSGDHLVEVYQAGNSEWALLGSQAVSSDCIVPEPEIPVVPETPTTPVVPVVQDLAPAARVTDFELAETGTEQGPLLMAGGIAAAAAVAGLLLALTRRRTSRG